MPVEEDGDAAMVRPAPERPADRCLVDADSLPARHRMISQLGGTRTSNTTAVPCDGKTDGSTTATDNSRPGDGLFRMLVDSANAGVGPEEVASG
ncbi:hypothetical protein [Streptomyces acidicola]|uniref:hypothetical protein n=1 Tax=Streptomyces acidicola TaxID=2596892 RepID=UPI00188358DF|nr:hypothetical protein [Streptomyces acidicola]